MCFLKHRINVLCKTKNISRKMLVADLMTLSHFSNILSGRYPFSSQMAKQMAQKLDEKAEYLLQAGDITNAQQAKLNEYLNILFTRQPFSSEQLKTLQQKNNSVTVELTRHLILAAYYIQSNQNELYEKVYTNYLEAYLDEFNTEILEELPLPLYKAFLYYKIVNSRSKGNTEDTLLQLEILLPLVQEPINIWYSILGLEIESLIKTAAFDQVNTRLELAHKRIRENNVLSLLSGFYLTQSAFLYRIHLIQDSLIALNLSEECLPHANDTTGVLTYSIINNRISILIKCRELIQAQEQIKRLSDWADAIQDKKSKNFLSTNIHILNCELYHSFQMTDEFIKSIENLEKMTKNATQDIMLQYYLGLLAYLNTDYEKTTTLLKLCLPYFTSSESWDYALKIYEILAQIANTQNKYKISADYFKKALDLYKDKLIN